MNRNKGVYTGSKIPERLKKLIKLTVQSKGYLNESEFVRNAIKEKLQRENLKELDPQIGDFSKSTFPFGMGSLTTSEDET